ncbi:unnamed protein product, partial [Cylindrotheca closterium]
MSTPVAISNKPCLCGYDSSSCGGGHMTSQLNNSSRKRKLQGASKFDDVLMEGMKNLSFDQIQREQELLHGVADDVDLDDNTIDDLLLELESHLHCMKKGTAYELAERQDPSYVSNWEFQLAFLRSSHFEPKASAAKLINFFKYKPDLFDEDSLVQDITVQDLNQDDLRCLLDVNIQFSPFCDRSGRTIFAEFLGLRTKTTIRTVLQARLYMLANSVETMIDISKGSVIVGYLVEQYHDHLNGLGMLEGGKLFMEAVPFRLDGLHLCCSNPIECMVTRASIKVLPYQERVKLQVHLGSHTEFQYLLTSYGITRGSLPLKGKESEMDLSYHNAWFQRRMHREEEQRQQAPALIHSARATATHQRNTSCHDTASGPNSANENNVLCLAKRVKGVGNERLHSLALIYLSAYDNGSISNHRTIVAGIIDEVH